MKHIFTHAGKTYTIELSRAAGGYRVHAEGKVIDIVAEALGGGRLRLIFPDRTVILQTAADGEKRWVALDGSTYELQRERRARRKSQGSSDGGEGLLRAPMPGQVRSVNASVGDEVAKGQTILILEAMKMEIRIQAASAGTLTAMSVKEGEQVDKGQVLAEIKQERND